MHDRAGNVRGADEGLAEPCRGIQIAAWRVMPKAPPAPSARPAETQAGPGVEETLRRTLDRIRRQFHAVGQASQLEALAAGDVVAAAREIVVIASDVTGCERVNVWLFNEDETELRCIEAFEASTRRHSSGMILREPDFRSEFQALKSARYVNADDPLTDPRTAGYVEGYLKPNRITSMLDAVVRASGRNMGLLCFEHVDRPHHWTEDEIAFACQLADKIGLALMTEWRRLSEERLRESRAELAEAQTIAKVGNWGIDLRTGRLTWSDESARLFGIDPPTFEPTIERFIELLHPDDREPTLRAFEAAIGRRTEFSAEYRVPKPDGSMMYVHARGRATYDVSGHPVKAMGTVQDITERKWAEEEVRQSARRDPLTGLPNRAAFLEQMDLAMSRSRRVGRPFAVLFVDLDRFKDINDTLGHAAGDELLRSVAARLRSGVRRTDTVARFGGDEFGIILADLESPADAGRLAQALIAAIARPFTILGNEVQTGASIGVALYESTARPDIDALLAHADFALYRAKSDGRGEYRFFTDAMDTEVKTRVSLTAELRHAIGSDELFLLYQPQIELETGRVTAVEALVRWRHPERGILEPERFVRLAEETGLMRQLTRWVLRRACQQGRAWLDMAGCQVRLAVNLSAAQFKTPSELAEDVAAALRETGFPPGRLELELTEAVLMRAALEQNDVLEPLRAQGVRLAIDDFGQGYSSLDYLRRYSVDRMKIAHSFVKQIADHEDSAAIVRIIVALARQLGLRVTAEGVEDEQQVLLLRRWGCQDVQGYVYARPMPAEALLERLRDGRWEQAAPECPAAPVPAAS